MFWLRPFWIQNISFWSAKQLCRCKMGYFKPSGSVSTSKQLCFKYEALWQMQNTSKAQKVLLCTQTSNFWFKEGHFTLKIGLHTQRGVVWIQNNLIWNIYTSGERMEAKRPQYRDIKSCALLKSSEQMEMFWILIPRGVFCWLQLVLSLQHCDVGALRGPTMAKNRAGGVYGTTGF